MSVFAGQDPALPAEKATIALLPDAARAVTAVVEAIGPTAWAAPSPCQGWSVRDVLNHLVAEHRWAPRLLAGESLTQVGDAYDLSLIHIFQQAASVAAPSAAG